MFLFIGINCTGPPRQREKKRVATEDMLGRKVMVPEKVEKIVGLRAGALRLLVYMDAIDLIAGIEEIERRSYRPYLLAHPELKELPIIGPSMGG